MKKGFLFTMDTFLGLILVIAIILTFNFFKSDLSFKDKRYQKISCQSQDIIDILSELKVREVQSSSIIQQLISEGKLNEQDFDKSLLDVSTSFFYTGNETIASLIVEEVLQNISSNVCVEVLVGSDSLYQSCNKTRDEDYSVSTKIETGYEIGRPTEGYTARAFLSSISGKTTSSYVYFGGYVGDGNITRILSLPSFSEIEEVYMEMDLGGNFDLYINGNSAGSYLKSSGGGGIMIPDKWYIDPSEFSHFEEGNNTITLNFTLGNSYIGGGHLRVTYETSELAPEEETGASRYYFPGIQGFINIYSSSYVPGDLKGMSAHLHYKNNYTTYLTLGNTEIYRDNQTSEQSVDISNATLSGLFDYNDLSGETIPIRLGTGEISVVQEGGNADVILVTDLSGSMNWELESSSTGVDRDCDDPDLYDGDTKRISLARCLAKDFVNILLNTTGNRVGLVGYSGKPNYMCTGNSDPIISYHDLTTDLGSLETQIEDYEPDGATGICGAIRQARLIMESQGDPSKQKFIVVMTDGLANVQCDPNDEDDVIGCLNFRCPYTSTCQCFGRSDCLYYECGDWVSDEASNDAVQDSCKAYQDTNSTIHSIGFGTVGDCPIGNQTLWDIADCGNGDYYESDNATELQEIYRGIAESIVEITYQTQIINVTGNFTQDNVLYPDSYIEFNYIPSVVPYDYGEISFTREADKLGELTGDDIDDPYKEGWFNISEQIKVVDAKITSYSSDYWTDRLYVKNQTATNWTNVYWLGDYGDDYSSLGDPYIVQIPSDMVGSGNNSVRIGTGLSPLNGTGGSPDNRVIYTARVKGSVGYGDVFNSSLDAVDDAVQRLIDEIEDYVNVTEDDIVMENQTLGGLRWLWGPSLAKVVVWEK
ncbi:MAG: VWA domain-containing protein [Candidatus Aenigmarchaeota archaeon]|nr:VWA domain-containing protein [Candidatus Aenigmarchaeota archaeon]